MIPRRPAARLVECDPLPSRHQDALSDQPLSSSGSSKLEKGNQPWLSWAIWVAALLLVRIGALQTRQFTAIRDEARCEAERAPYRPAGKAWAAAKSHRNAAPPKPAGSAVSDATATMRGSSGWLPFCAR